MRHERLKQAIEYTLTRVEAYLIVILVFAAVIIARIGGWPVWIGVLSIVAGVVLLALLVIDSLSDPTMDRKTSLLDIEPERIVDASLREKLVRAVGYVQAAQKLAEMNVRGIADAEDDELPQLEQAARSIYQVGLRLQDFRSDKLIQRDLTELREQKSKGRLSSDQAAQLAALERLDALADEGAREIDNSLAHLGTAYAQIRTIKATPEIKGVGAEGLEQLRSSTKHLSDLADSYDELFADRPSGGTPARG